MTQAGHQDLSRETETVQDDTCRSMVGPNSVTPILPVTSMLHISFTGLSSPSHDRKPLDHRSQHLQACTIHTCESMASQDTGRPLPKFGEWDVNNPASAEGYTVIFKRARDEKTGHANTETSGKPEALCRHDSYPRKSKWLCWSS